MEGLTSKANYGNESAFPEVPKYPHNGQPHYIHERGWKITTIKLKINKALVADDLPAYIFREKATKLAPVLTASFAQSLKTGTLHSLQEVLFSGASLETQVTTRWQ